MDLEEKEIHHQYSEKMTNTTVEIMKTKPAQYLSLALAIIVVVWYLSAKLEEGDIFHNHENK